MHSSPYRETVNLLPVLIHCQGSVGYAQAGQPKAIPVTGAVTRPHSCGELPKIFQGEEGGKGRKCAHLEGHHGGPPEEEGGYEQQQRCQLVYS